MVILPLAALASVASALISLETKGKRFIQPNTDAHEEGTAFFARGIDYLPGGSSGYTSSSGVDALSDPDVCYRDAYVFQQLGINTVRIYSLNPDLDHNECMTILNNAGIYVLLDVNSGEYGSNLDRADPEGTYNAYYMSHVFKFIEAFKNFPNVLGFFSGNEVINDQSDYASTTPKYVRAVQRDMKQYIAKHSNRTIPVGYSAADGVELRRATLEYLQCHISDEDDDISRSDFFGLNSYEWCSGSSDWQSSGYEALNSTLSNTSIPLLFSEFGCNKNSPRTFDEISDGLFGGLVNTFSGGLVYEYSEEASNYGVVDISSDGDITYLADYTSLSNQYHNVTIPEIHENDVGEIDAPECDADRITAIYPEFGADFDIPEQSNDTAWLIEHGVNATNIGKLLSGIEAKGSNHTIYNTKTSEVSSATVTFLSEYEVNSQSNVPTSSTASSSVSGSAPAIAAETATASSSATSSSKGIAALVTPSVSAMLFALVSYLI